MSEIIYDEEVTIQNYDGAELIIIRTFDDGETIIERALSYTELSAGSIKFGYRDLYSYARHARYSVISEYNTSRVGLYLSADNIKIGQDLPHIQSNGGISVSFVCKLGAYYGFTGYLSVITKVDKSQQYGFDWTVERLPFLNGLCVVKR